MIQQRWAVSSPISALRIQMYPFRNGRDVTKWRRG